ncbi:MAG TPA: hypothetical protein VKY22_10570 [Bradyrhizobium sp.]|nr:hypothetical protein [Bradyrhizobium sp.]
MRRSLVGPLLSLVVFVLVCSFSETSARTRVRPHAIWDTNCWNLGDVCNEADFILMSSGAAHGHYTSKYGMNPTDVPFTTYDGNHSDVTDLSSVLLFLVSSQVNGVWRLDFELDFSMYNRVHDDRADRAGIWLWFYNSKLGPSYYREFYIDGLGGDQPASGRVCGNQSQQARGSLPADLEFTKITLVISEPHYQAGCPRHRRR